MSARVTGLWLALSLAPFGACWAGAASAQSAAAPSAEQRTLARRHFERGVELAKREAYAEALAEFRQAYELFPHYSALYNIAEAYVALEQPVEALEALKRYLAEGGTNIDLERRKEVEAEIIHQYSKTALIEVVVDVAAAKISVDGQAHGRAPLSAPIRVAAGAHRLLATLDSGETREASLNAAGEQKYRVELKFAPASAVATPTAPPPSAAGAAQPVSVRVVCSEAGVLVSIDAQSVGTTPLGQTLAVGAGSHRIRFTSSLHLGSERELLVREGMPEVDCGFAVAPRNPSPAPRHSATKSVAFALGAVGIALGGAALAHYIWNRGRYQDWQSEYSDYLHDPTATRRDNANQLAQSITQASALTVGLAIGAGVALGAGTLLLVTNDSGARTQGMNSSRPWVAWSGVW